ncbi:unnamed protein product [Ambrosiozyma monospora]|uniref:Unnamed protein product n=1 Tax=Ambrosiozyma monospora TaxID=43982 RepID=A0ACB5TCP1_AMBMO|nr:unnamed protein product [Ambrosiozyma monospora]
MKFSTPLATAILLSTAMAVPITVSEYPSSHTATAKSQLPTTVSTAVSAASSLSASANSSDEETTEVQMKSIGSFFKSIGTKLSGVGGKVGTALDVISLITTGASIVGALLPSSSSSSNGTAVDTDSSGSVSLGADISSQLSAALVSAATATDISPELEAAVSSAMALADSDTTTTASGTVQTVAAVKRFEHASNSSSTSLPVQTSLSFDDLTEVQQKSIASLGSLFSSVVSNMGTALDLSNGLQVRPLQLPLKLSTLPLLIHKNLILHHKSLLL